MTVEYTDLKKKIKLNNPKQSCKGDNSKTPRSQQPPFTCLKSALKNQAFKTSLAAKAANLSSLRGKANQ